MLFNCLVVASIFGLTPILEKHILSFIKPETFIVLSGFLVFLISILFYIFVYKHNIYDEMVILKDNRNIFLLMILTVFLIYFLANYVYLNTISENKTHLVTALVATYPIITLTIAYLFLNEDVTFYHTLGVFFIVGGVILLNI
jgi:drug/metabolite transporter (DMT)-like permease